MRGWSCWKLSLFQYPLSQVLRTRSVSELRVIVSPFDLLFSLLLPFPFEETITGTSIIPNTKSLTFQNPSKSLLSVFLDCMFVDQEGQ